MKVSTPWAWSLLAERGSRTILHPRPAFLPAPTCARRWSEYPLTASLSWRATGKRPRPWRRTTEQVAATSDLAPSGGPVSTGLSARNGGDSPARVPPQRRVADQSDCYLPIPQCTRPWPGPHLRRAAVAVLISYGLDATGACHSNVAALEAQVYAHHRHGAGYSSGSSPGLAGEAGHGPRRGWRAESGPRRPGDRCECGT